MSVVGAVPPAGVCCTAVTPFCAFCLMSSLKALDLVVLSLLGSVSVGWHPLGSD